MIPIIKPVVTSPAPCCLGREMGRIGNENLHGNRAKTDHQRGEKEWQWLSGKRRRKQGQCRYADNAKDQIPVFDEVAERHDQKQARDVTHLGHRHDQSCRFWRQAKRCADGSDEWLGIIEVGPSEHARRAESG
jgi:hypothetical protein